MKKNICLLGLTASLSLFAACSAEEETYTLGGQQSDAIEFSTYIKQGARSASKDAFVNGDVLGLYASQTTGNYINVFTDNFMSNVAVTKSTTGWSYSPLATWPTDAEKHLSFVAYYPRNISQTSALAYPFALGVDANGHQIDPMWCTVKDACISDRNGTMINGNEADAAFEPNSGPLALKFNHMLSRVKVAVKLDAAYPGITVKLNSLILTDFYTGGTFTIANNLASGSWTSFSARKSYELLSTSNEAVEIQEAGSSFCDTLMIPQNVASVAAYFYLTYTHTLAEGGEKTVTKTIYLPGAWLPNHLYNYTIKLSLDINNISISAEVNDMSEGVTEKAPDAVDLGLSVKWASHNLGATKAEETGAYYAWGEVKPKLSFTQSNYEHYIQNNVFEDIGDDISGTIYDAAYVQWGSSWRMPTKEQVSELISNCTWTWTTLNGVYGYKVESKNGNYIFLPSAYYWTGDKASSSSYPTRYAYTFVCSGTKGISTKDRYVGCAIRPVSD